MGPRRLTWRWRVIAAIVIVLVRVLRWRIDVRGLEHVPRRGGAVLAFNHHSYVDFLMVAWPVVRQLRRPLRFLAKREIWSSPRVGWVVRWAEAVPVDRGSAAARASAFDAAADALDAGDLVAVAPEQTISPSYELLPLRTGAARMAQLAGVPSVPVIGWGTQRVLPKGGRAQVRTRVPVTVRFGTPIEVAPDEDPVAATEVLAARMQELLDEVQRNYPDGTPPGAPWVPARLGGGAPDHAEVVRAHRERERGWTPGSGRDDGATPGSGRDETRPGGQERDDAGPPASG
ncbi:MAG: lysophospholipid acyltransferase family protein, partial [Nitriliruptoraceae bacterium]